MRDNRRNFVFRTQNLLKQGFYRNGALCWDSHIQILAHSWEESQVKLKAYIEFGRKIGFYK
jgi:hypothetical protein